MFGSMSVVNEEAMGSIRAAAVDTGTFDGGNADITFSLNEDFEANLEKAINRKLNADTIVQICRCPAVLRFLGKRDLPLVAKARV